MKNVLFFLAVALSFSSCYHVYYAPNTAHVPLLADKAETRINALYTIGGDSDYGGGELQLSHAITDKLAIMFNAFTAEKTQTDWDDNLGIHTDKGKGSYKEMGGGYFKALGKSKMCIAELYVGAGMGSVESEYGYGDISIVRSKKLFLQPALGFKGDHFEIGFSPRVSLINWKVKENNVVNDANAYLRKKLDIISSKRSFVAFEPAIILRGGSKSFKAQAGFSFCTNDKEIYNNGLTETFNASFGISLNLHPSKRIKNNKPKHLTLKT